MIAEPSPQPGHQIPTGVYLSREAGGFELNLCVTGSLATILWLLALRKDSGRAQEEKLDVTFWEVS